MKARRWGFLAVRGAWKAAGLALVLAATGGTAEAGAGPPAPPAPEIDPGSALSALALLSGGLMILTDRRRAKSK